MAYHYLDYHQLHAFCTAAFRSYGFDETTSGEITDVLLAADLNGTESTACSAWCATITKSPAAW